MGKAPKYKIPKRHRVYPCELLEWIGRSPDLSLLSQLGITHRQYMIWLGAEKGVWISTAQFHLIQFKYRCNLGEILGKDWDSFVIRGKQIEVPGMKRPLSSGELRSVWVYVQQVGALSAQLQQSARENERLSKDLEELERQVHFYRHQLILESTVGLMLNRITAPE